jgi:hypothetical protein
VLKVRSRSRGKDFRGVA